MATCSIAVLSHVISSCPACGTFFLPICSTILTSGDTELFCWRKRFYQIKMCSTLAGHSYFLARVKEVSCMIVLTPKTGVSAPLTMSFSESKS